MRPQSMMTGGQPVIFLKPNSLKSVLENTCQVHTSYFYSMPSAPSAFSQVPEFWDGSCGLDPGFWSTEIRKSVGCYQGTLRAQSPW